MGSVLNAPEFTCGTHTWLADTKKRKKRCPFCEKPPVVPVKD
jgi:hypothetical protein